MCEVPKTFTDDEAEYMTQSATHHWLSINCWTCELRSDKKQLRTTMQCRSHSRRRSSECLFVTACIMDEYAEEKRTEKNLIVLSGISEAETTNNKVSQQCHSACSKATRILGIINRSTSVQTSGYYVSLRLYKSL